MKIKNWSQFQHYKDRRPPWIKLYRELLDDLEYHQLKPVAAKYLPLLWLIGSENCGELPDPERLAFRLRLGLKECVAICTELSHWLEHDASDMLATSLHDATPERAGEETEKERETETETDICGMLASRIGILYRRKPETAWSDKEKSKLREVAKRADATAELATIETAWTAGWQYHRQDIQTLLNNWTAEVDKANQFLARPAEQPELDGLAIGQKHHEEEPLKW